MSLVVLTPEAATMSGTYDDNGFSVIGNSPSYGDMFFSGTADGNMTGRMPNVPSAFVDSTTLSGILFNNLPKPCVSLPKEVLIF
jgi:hypothetical protein